MVGNLSGESLGERSYFSYKYVWYTEDMETAESTASIAPNQPQALAHACGPAGLSFEQLQAIPLLVEGRQGKEVAALVGVRPETVSVWRTSNDAFREEYTRQRTLLYESGLQRAYSRIDAQLDHDDAKVVQGAAKVRLEHHAQMTRASQSTMVTVVLDKLQAALAGVPADAIDAEYEAIASGEVPALAEGAEGSTEAEAAE